MGRRMATETDQRKMGPCHLVRLLCANPDIAVSLT
jgi:hypothetical protein